jgi:hypothetical protein
MFRKLRYKLSSIKLSVMIAKFESGQTIITNERLRPSNVVADSIRRIPSISLANSLLRQINKMLPDFRIVFVENLKFRSHYIVPCFHVNYSNSIQPLSSNSSPRSFITSPNSSIVFLPTSGSIHSRFSVKGP